MIIGITNMWTYRDKLKETRFGMSLQAYNAEQHKWVHIGYFKPNKIKRAAKEYERVMGMYAVNPKHLDFSFNNLIEVEQMLMGSRGSLSTDQYINMWNMIKKISEILQIKIEVLNGCK